MLLHHAVIPYTYFGHTDPKSWIGFDCVVLATDSFFMAMFFFLSGLFVWPGIARKGPLNYLLRPPAAARPAVRDRAFTLIPLAYYAISLRQHPDVGFSAFWWKTVTVGPWPSGPIWFVWVLLAFDLIAVPAVSALAQPARSDQSPVAARFDRPADSSLVMLAVTAALYIPGRIYFGAGSWFEFGPFSVQHGRVLLYATYFFFGAGVGVQLLDRGLLARTAGWRRSPGTG